MAVRADDMARVGGKGGRRRPTRDEKVLWDTVTADVTPLGDDRPADIDAEDSEIADAPSPIMTGKRRPTAVTATPGETSRRAPGAEPELRHGAAPGLDNRTRLRLRRGQVEVEARMDLHGLTRNQAHARLTAFLEGAYGAGRRAVLVITGKGTGRDGELGILRREVPQWLNEPPMRNWVKAFDHAAPRDGGEGALYVLLRRKR